MSKECINCNRHNDCPKFELIDADNCENYTSTANQRIIDNARQESIRLLELEVPEYTRIENLIQYLESKSEISPIGKMSTETTVNKEALRLAATYLQNYYLLLEYHVH